MAAGHLCALRPLAIDTGYPLRVAHSPVVLQDGLPRCHVRAALESNNCVYEGTEWPEPDRHVPDPLEITTTPSGGEYFQASPWA